ncbi:DUF6509 family protein [Paenibacillus gansuensis]|uniref:DUF6509 family protein n=1 Tax=Paenibacillus gansuensis TaxID=306542 RepID=A0ABW5PDC5_9BACL
MLDITEYSVEYIKDPFGIVEGKRYEFLIDINVDEDDELSARNGVYIRAIYAMREGVGSLVKYDLLERGTDKYLEFDLEEEEEAALLTFCNEHWNDAEEL